MSQANRRRAHVGHRMALISRGCKRRDLAIHLVRFQVPRLHPLLMGAILLPDMRAFYGSLDSSVVLKAFLFGCMWGVGNVSYGSPCAISACPRHRCGHRCHPGWWVR